MGRSTRAQADQNRVRIVDAATGLFRDKGVTAVSIAEIMDAAGMTQGGFYKHFASKEALAAEACTQAFNLSIAAWQANTQSSSQEDGATMLQQLVQYYLTEKAPDKTCPMIALGQDAAGESPSQPFCQAYRKGAHQLFDTFLQVVSPEPNERQREHLMLLFASMVGANLLKRAVGNEPWIQEMQQALMKNLLKEYIGD